MRQYVINLTNCQGEEICITDENRRLHSAKELTFSHPYTPRFNSHAKCSELASFDYLPLNFLLKYGRAQSDLSPKCYIARHLNWDTIPDNFCGSHLGAVIRHSNGARFSLILALCIWLTGCSVLHLRRRTPQVAPPIVDGVPGAVSVGVIGGIVSSTPAPIPKLSTPQPVKGGSGGDEYVRVTHSPKKDKTSLQYVSDPLDAQLQKVLKSATDGWIKYNPPKEMTEGEPTKITVQLLRPDANGAIQANPGSLLGTGEARSSSVKISEEMKITLLSADADAFAIKESDNSKDGVQTVLPGGGANWYWDVTAKEIGERHLRLIASIVVRSGADERHQDFATFDTPIRIVVHPKPPIPERVGTILIGLGEQNWKWFFGLLPLAELTRMVLRRSKSGQWILSLYTKDEDKHGGKPKRQG